MNHEDQMNQTSVIDTIIKSIILNENWIKSFCDDVVFNDEKWIKKYNYHKNDDEPFNAELEEYNIMDEHDIDDYIIQPLFNDYQTNFTSEIIETISYKERIEIFKYVMNRAKDYNMLDDVITYFNSDDWIKICDFYAYHKAKEMIDECGEYDIHYEIEMMIDKYYEETLHEQQIIDTSMNIAVNKILRSRIYNTGLGLKINMSKCGIELHKTLERIQVN
jgi:hypothetical protein